MFTDRRPRRPGMTCVFLTIDTEFAWRHHAAGLAVEDIYARSIEPAGVGLSYQLGLLARHDLRATFFVDPMPALVHGLKPIARVVETILAAGQDVQLHLHANWTGARAGDRGARHGRFNLDQYGEDEQADLIGGAADLLVAAGAPRPVAFRAGSFAANDATLAVLASLGFAYDSSFNGAVPHDIGLPPDTIAPLARGGVIEVPLTLITEAPGRLRPFQICALSTGEAGQALSHAVRARHAAVTIVGHSFELANRFGTTANAVHVRRFDALCTMLAASRSALPTTRFADRPALALGGDDRPLPADRLRTGWRQAQQLWSNVVAERAA